MSTLHSNRRSAFTLIELLVVIAIIAVLAALSSAAIMKFLGAQPVGDTRKELKTLQIAFHKKWIEVTEQASKGTMEGNEVAINTLAGSNPGLARVIWVKMKQKQAFPQTFFEALNPVTVGTATLQPLPGYKTYLNKYGFTATSVSNANPQVYESSVCLLMALRRSTSGGGEFSAETFGTYSGTLDPSAPSGIAVGYSGAAGLPYLTDAWKNPIQFGRWPLGNSVATPSDPTDPQNLLMTLTAPNQLVFAAGLHDLAGSSNTTRRATPLIASMGGDGKPGLSLGSPGTATNWAESPPDSNDNIYANNLP